MWPPLLGFRVSPSKSHVTPMGMSHPNCMNRKITKKTLFRTHPLLLCPSRSQALRLYLLLFASILVHVPGRVAHSQFCMEFAEELIA